MLQVDPAADAGVIDAAYRRLVREHHPDVSARPDAVQRTRELNAAYEVLRDPARRAAYDRERAATTSRASAAQQRGTTGAPTIAPTAVCYRHCRSRAIATCARCGSSLCTYCARCFEPPACVPCTLVLTGRQRRRRRGRLLLFPLLLTLAYALVSSKLWPYRGPRAAGLALAAGYWTASLASGSRVVSRFGSRLPPALRLLLAMLLAPALAPYDLIATLADLRDLRTREWIARSLL